VRGPHRGRRLHDVSPRPRRLSARVGRRARRAATPTAPTGRERPLCPNSRHISKVKFIIQTVATSSRTQGPRLAARRPSPTAKCRAPLDFSRSGRPRANRWRPIFFLPAGRAAEVQGCLAWSIGQGPARQLPGPSGPPPRHGPLALASSAASAATSSFILPPYGVAPPPKQQKNCTAPLASRPRRASRRGTDMVRFARSVTTLVFQVALIDF